MTSGCRKNLNHGLYYWLFFHFSSFWVRYMLNAHSNQRFRIENLDCCIFSDFKFYLIYLIASGNLPEKSPFLSAQMHFLTNFFQVFIVLEVYNLNVSRKSHTTAVNTSSKSSEKFQLLYWTANHATICRLSHNCLRLLRRRAAVALVSLSTRRRAIVAYGAALLRLR